VEVVYATLEVLDAEVELVLVTTPLALEVLDVDVADAIDKELEELE
jgi:hypothetical protein